MKKFYALALALVSFIAGSAQDLNVYYGDQLVKNGDVITVSEPHNTTIPGLGTKYEFTSNLFIEGEAESDITIRGEVTKYTTTYDGMGLSLCPKTCTYVENNVLENTFLYDPTNGKLDIQLHLGAQSFVKDIEQPIVDVELDMSIVYAEVPETEVKFKLVFCNDPNAAVSSIAKDNSSVKFANNILNVNLETASTVEIFSTTGARIKVVKGVKSAAINMSNLQKGIYFYRAGKKTGKFIVR